MGINIERFSEIVLKKFQEAGISDEVKAKEVAKTIFENANNSEIADTNTAALNHKEQEYANQQLEEKIADLKTENECKENAEKPQMGLESDDNVKTNTARLYHTYGSNGSLLAFGDNEDLGKEAKRALEYYRQNKSFDGFEVDKTLAERGYQIEFEVEYKYDNPDNDRAVARQKDDDKYETEIIQVSDGLKVVVRYVKEDEEVLDIYATTAEDDIPGDEERKKTKNGNTVSE